MTAFSLFPAGWRLSVMILVLAVTWFFLFLAVYGYSLGRKRLWVAADGFVFFFGILFTAVLIAQHDAAHAGMPGYLLEIPVFVPVVLAMGGIAYGSARLAVLRKYHKDQISKDSIRESFDNLPSGIALFDESGFPCMINRQMDLLCHFLLGRDVQSAQELRSALKHPVDRSVVFEPDTGLHRFPNGQVWRFTENTVTTEEGECFLQFLAADVRELYESQKELEDDNRKLQESAETMKELAHNILAVTREEETLAMKMRVHDDLGHSVLATHRLLVRGYTQRDALLLLEQWRKVLNLLYRDHETADSYDWMKRLKVRADILGLELFYRGSFPADEKRAHLLMEAMQECMTNSVRHGKATQLTITIEETIQMVTASITNNGSVPEGEIAEGGGLSGLRRKVEEQGGSMTVSSRPVFALTVMLPKRRG